MKIYLVGGAVRDKIMGLPSQDSDYVVVGSSPEEMVALKFKPIGKSFPVFLHPETNAEYALARTEKKTAKGYHGFEFYTSPSITLEQDLSRRDLTINAIAMDGAGVIYDPYNGVDDIKSKILRHVSNAFEEDPLRVLRVARFKARFKDFSIDLDTKALIQKIVLNNEMESLSSERVLVEVLKGFKEKDPLGMLEVLYESGALQRIMPIDFLENKTELETLYSLSQYKELSGENSLVVTMMTTHFSEGKIDSSFGQSMKKMKISSHTRKIFQLISMHGNKLISLLSLNKKQQLDCFYLFDFFRRPSLILSSLNLLNCTLLAHQKKSSDYSQSVKFLNDFIDLLDREKVNIDDTLGPEQIRALVYKKRLEMLESIH
ncbi:MAG TPA: hypothetical protein DHV86_05640 [Methylophilaceae bacterium]|jgi:tRNA nucleotidyltransferase/poly(A) polymerase|nr:hypothetical protein [Methylophilaceae bacterium]